MSAAESDLENIENACRTRFVVLLPDDVIQEGDVWIFPREDGSPCLITLGKGFPCLDEVGRSVCQLPQGIYLRPV